jgi:ATP-binding cassette subfamily D (ALD) long-chain fatty acid import protein
LCRHRPSLLKYHNRHLRLGESPAAPPTSPLASKSTTALSSLALTALSKQPGTPTAAQGWQLTTLASTTAEEKLELEMEITRLEEVLGKEVGEWERRLKEVNHELSAKTTSSD